MQIDQLKNHFMALQAKKADTKEIPEKDPKLEQSARDLEGLFLSFVLKSMEKTIPSDGNKSNTLANMMFSSVMGQSIAENGGLGLQDFFYGSLSKESVKNLENLKGQVQNPTINNMSLGGIRNDE